MSMNKINIRVFAESDYHNIEFDGTNFYYTAELGVEYLDMGGKQVKHHRYENLIRRMNKYFIKKKNHYDEDVI